MLILLLFSLIFIYFFNHFYWKRKDLPPGPVPLPLFGNGLAFINEEPPQTVIKWKKQYGDIYTFWLGELPVISISNFNTIIEKFIKEGDIYSGRPIDNLENLNVTRNGRTGVILTDNELWRDTRRFSLHTFRDFGVGKNLMEERILDEIINMFNSINDDINTNKNNQINIQKHIDISVGSIIMQLIFGYKYSSSEKTRNEFFKYKTLADVWMKETGSFVGLCLQRHINIFKHLPYFGTVYNRILNVKTNLFEMIEKNIENVRNRINFDTSINPDNYVEAFLIKQHEFEKKGEKNEIFTDKQLSGTLFDLYLAGQDTTSNTLGWACIYLVNNPKIQQKIHQELDEIIGSDRLITIDDKSNLHYINAVITEVQRLCNLVPNNVPHRVTKDVEIDGYKIPKNTIVTHQISIVLHDENIFPEPLKFKPERHLDDNNYFKPNPAVIPFGVGKRSCLGEALARMELFLFLANICNSYELKSDEYIKETRTLGITVPTPNYTLGIEKRFKHRS